MSTAAIAAGLGLGLTLLLMPGVLATLRRLEALDHPTERSSHAVPTLRGGGIGPWVACLVAMAVLPGLTLPARWAFLMAAAGFGAIGLLEDLRGVPTGRRFVAQVAVASAAVSLLYPTLEHTDWGVWVLPVAALWLVAYVNAFNFMDGINGISGAQATIAGAGFALMGVQIGDTQLAVAAGLAAGAALGFLPFNFPNARVFLGDAGSYFLGGWLGLVAILALVSGLPPEAAGAPLLIYLADTGTTLLRRVVRGETWHQPHRSHAYQRLTQLGWSHARTTAWTATAILGCVALGAVSVGASPPTRMWTTAGMAGFVAAYLASPTVVRSIGSRRTADV